MSMVLNGEIRLAASQELIWEKLNEPETLKLCIPGCEELLRLSENKFGAVAIVKVGPIRARFKGSVTLADIDPPNGYRISGEGDGGLAGFAKGGAVVRLVPKQDHILLQYSVDAQIGGKLAQLGQRLVSGTAKRLAEEFFQKFTTVVTETSAGEAA